MEWYSTSGFDSPTLNIIQKNILTGGQPWESFLVNQGLEAFGKRDASLSLRKMEEHATEIFSLFQSEYAIAYLYSAIEAKDSMNNPDELKKYVTIVQNRIVRGDKAITENSPRRDSQYGWGYYYKAFALENLYREGVNVNDDNVRLIDATYEKATEFRESVKRYPTAFPTRLRHLLFLGYVQLDEKAQNKLAEIIARATESSEAHIAYITALKKEIDNRWYASSFAHLATINADFKNHLVSVGWKTGK